MKLVNVYDKINNSNEEAWKRIEGLDNEYHTKLIFKDDINLEIYYGKSLNNNFKENWANQWMNPNARLIELKIFYNDKEIYKDSIVEVDGGRVSVLLPEPSQNCYSITEDGLNRNTLAKIISSFETYGLNNLNDALNKFKKYLNS